MGVVLLQILQWILRIILFLLLMLLVLIAVVLIVPIRYQVEGEFLEKKPGGRGKITWFFYLIYMTFVYEEDFRMQVRVCGFKVFDSAKESSGKTKSKKKSKETAENVVEESNTNDEEVKDGSLESHEIVKWEALKEEDSEKIPAEKIEDEPIFLEQEIETEEESNSRISQSEADISQSRNDSQDLEQSRNDLQDLEESRNDSQDLEESRNDLQDLEQSQDGLQNIKNDTAEKEKKSLSEKIEGIKSKIQEIIQKIKDIIAKIQEGKLKIEHYLELWNRKETQITFSRAKTKFGRMIKAILPRKWKVTGEVGFDNPATTGQLMGALGAMYPILGNKVQIVPNFENEVINIEGRMKGHIRLGNLLYQLVSLILNRHCFKFIKLILDELGSSKKSKKGDIDNGRK